MTESQSILIELIGSVLEDRPTSFNKLSDEMLQEVYTIARRHDLSHFIGAALTKKKFKASDNSFSKYQNNMFETAVRMQRLDYELNCACQALEDAGIQFVPLKGSVVKKYYPEPWMRTSCDIDILVHKEDLENAISAINKDGRFQVGKQKYHDVSLISKSKINIELHFSILETMDNIDNVLKEVWEYAELGKNNNYAMQLTPEFFLYHIYAHATYHFLNGGCGIKTLMDIYLLENKLDYNKGLLEELLEKAEIKTFRNELKNLSNVWFSDGTRNGNTDIVEKYILSGGVYGSKNNALAVKSTEQTAKRYMMSRIFMPYKQIKLRYPILQKHKYLTPFFEVARWIDSISKGKHKAYAAEAKTINSITEIEMREVDTMLKNLGLREENK